MNKSRPLLALTILASMFTACEPTCNPGRDDVCDHLIDLMKKEIGESAIDLPENELTKLKEECLKEEEREKEKLGAYKYSARARCVMRSTSIEDVYKCDGQ